MIEGLLEEEIGQIGERALREGDQE